MSQTTIDKSLKEQIAEDLEKNPAQFTGVLARRYGVSELDILRAHPEEKCCELNPEKIEDVIRELETLGTMMVICTNEAAILEVNGRFGGYSKEMGFFNILTDTLDMHLTLKNITSAFCHIKKPHTGGNVTHSLQFYKEDGRPAFKAFILKSNAEEFGDNYDEQIEGWKSLREKYKINAG